MKRIVSLIIVALMLISVFSVQISALDLVDNNIDIDAYISTDYTTQQSRVDKMNLVYTTTEYGYSMYLDSKSGEFAIKNLKTGEYTFSNPYDIAIDNNSNLTDKQKMELLSQIILTYADVETGTITTINSFEQAAYLGGQIEFKEISNGIRAEYAIGTLESKRLIPIWIEKSRFDTKIYDVLSIHVSEMTEDEKFVYNHLFDTYYNLKDQTDPDNASSVEEWRKNFKCLDNDRTLVIYTFQQVNNARALKNVEALIRKYCPEYTYDELEYDHEVTGYEGDQKEPALFRLAVEYTFDENGFNASIPSKSIRYNETNYSLESIKLLPYFGCASTKTVGNKVNTGGYLFIPDGSGTLLSFYEVDGSLNTGTQGSKVFGIDYAYENLGESNSNAQIYRYPVFGIVDYYRETVETKRTSRPSKFDTVDYQRGFLAIVSEGESFSSIIANMQSIVAGSGDCRYNTVSVTFSAKLSDTVSLGNSLGSGQSLSTSIDTKYLGNYTITYVLLSDPNLAKAANYKSFEPSYIGMANAYRDYLVRNSNLERLTASEIESSIPLYIQSFGSLTFSDKFLSLPVEVEKPLTTFEDIITMNEQLKENGITNTRFILTAFANGNNFNGYYPTYVKWRNKLGGESGFKKLIAYAEENDMLVFPNFDFVNVYKANLSFSYTDYAAKSMSGRYTTKREYDYLYQSFSTTGFSNIVSSGSFDEIYNKFIKYYAKYNVGNIAALTLGTDLNSDFDDENPITREDSKDYTVDLMRRMKEDNANVLVSSGNQYSLKYATDLIDIPIDNSGFLISTNSIPFSGMVLHGYYNYASTAINMAGDVQYQLLKSIENGSSLYFILSYRNTELLKSEDRLSKYYSVDFNIWLNDIIKNYNTLNDAIGKLQNAIITDHGFVNAFRAEKGEANALFEIVDYSANLFATSKKEYFDAMDVVDQLIRNSKNFENEVIIETEKQGVYNNASTLNNLVNKTANRYYVGDVVYVTYTSVDGAETTFYINYNSFDVLIKNPNGGISSIKAQSFVEKSKLETINIKVDKLENIVGYSGTGTQMTTVNETYDLLQQALSDNNQLKINRYKETLAHNIEKMTKESNILLVTNNDGSVYLINTNAKNVFVQIDDTTCINLAGESYAEISNLIK